jgi:chaperonin GroES
MKIRPLQDRVVVKRKEEETKSAGGIVIPGSAAEKPSQGVVVAIGPGRYMEDGSVRKVDLKVGDKVIFGKYASNTIKIDDEELLILAEGEIYGVLQD